jgi:hypothetical protein
MWKVKRMNTAPIVVPATAAGSIAAYLANGSDTKPFLAEPIAQLPAMGAVVAKDGPITHGADLMTTVLFAGIRPPSLTETLT